MPFGQRDRSPRSNASRSDALIFVEVAISASDLPRRSRSLFSRAQNSLRLSEASTDVMTWMLRDLAIPDLTGSCETAHRYYCDAQSVRGSFPRRSEKRSDEKRSEKKRAGPFGDPPIFRCERWDQGDPPYI